MRYTIDPTHSQPAYLQFYHQLREDIVRGIYPYGKKLPSKRLVAADTGVNVITVEHAYAILCDEGYLESRQRSGYFVIYREEEAFPVTLRENAELPVLSHESHLKDPFPFSVLARTMRRVLSDYGETILVKSPNNGCAELRRAVAAYLARSRGISVQPSQIIIGSGAEYLYSLLVQFLGKEHIFALESPSYEMIRQVYQANGIRCDMLKLGKDGIRSEELERTEATVLHATPFNSYPSHITASASKRMEYIRWASRRGGFIIEDDFDSEFTVSTKAEDTLFSPEPMRSVFYLNTFSQTIAPSIRVGYMVLPFEKVEVFQQKVGFYSCTVPVFEQYVLAELINSGDFERHIHRVRRARRKRQGNKKMRCHFCDNAFLPF